MIRHSCSIPYNVDSKINPVYDIDKSSSLSLFAKDLSVPPHSFFLRLPSAQRTTPGRNQPRLHSIWCTKHRQEEEGTSTKTWTLLTEGTHVHTRLKSYCSFWVLETIWGQTHRGIDLETWKDKHKWLEKRGYAHANRGMAVCVYMCVCVCIRVSAPDAFPAYMNAVLWVAESTHLPCWNQNWLYWYKVAWHWTISIQCTMTVKNE